jgi:hypothetical protein
VAWEQLLSIYQYAADIVREERSRPPEACPNDGTPLVQGQGGTLRCTHDGWQWPEERIVEVNRSFRL